MMAKTRSKKKTEGECATCKKQPIIKTLEVPTEEYIVTPEDIKKAWGLLSETKLLKEEDNFKYTSGIFKLVTGRELDLGHCTACRITKIKRIYSNNVRLGFGITL